MWNEYLLSYWSVLVLKYTAALINAFGPSLSWCKLPRLNEAKQIYIIWRHSPWHVVAAFFFRMGQLMCCLQCLRHINTAHASPQLDCRDHPVIPGAEGRDPFFLWRYVSWFVWCFAQVLWNSRVRVSLGSLHTQQHSCHQSGILPVLPWCLLPLTCEPTPFPKLFSVQVLSLRFLTLMFGTYSWNGWKSN